MTFEQAKSAIKPPSEVDMVAAKRHWGRVAKPLDSLGALEDIAVLLAGIQRVESPVIDKRCLVIMCADNGVVAEGVTQTDSSVTATMAANFAKGNSTACTMARYLGVDVKAVDIGIARAVDGVLDRNIQRGTANIAVGAAMTKAAAVAAIEAGINLAADLKAEGYTLILTGEMGIGNTTTASALAAVLLEEKIEEVTGRGAGLSGAGLAHKIEVIKRALAVNAPDKNDALDALAKVGGLDIAGMVGLFIGGAAAGVCVMIDGFISGIAAIIAGKICPASKDYMLATHVSAEPAGQAVLDVLGLRAILTAGMCLGEGTGALAALAVIDLGMEIYHNGTLFEQTGVENYVHLT